MTKLTATAGPMPGTTKDAQYAWSLANAIALANPLQVAWFGGPFSTLVPMRNVNYYLLSS